MILIIKARNMAYKIKSSLYFFVMKLRKYKSCDVVIIVKNDIFHFPHSIFDTNVEPTVNSDEVPSGWP